jgi:hypothetical protein
LSKDFSKEDLQMTNKHKKDEQYHQYSGKCNKKHNELQLHTGMAITKQNNNKKQKQPGAGGSHLIILVTWEAEIRRLSV